MSITNSSKKTKLCILFFGAALFSLASCSDNDGMIEEKIMEFQSCLETKPLKIKGKICNAYVSFGGEISELTNCLSKEKIKAIDYEKDNVGNIFEINVSFSCNSGKRFAVRFDKFNSSKEYDIAWVGEIVY